MEATVWRKKKRPACEVIDMKLIVFILPQIASCHPAGEEENPGGGDSLST